MVTFAQFAANGGPATVIITIEGCGNYDGLFKFCTRVPNYALGNANYRPWLTEWPKGGPERLNLQAGVPESGDLLISLLDSGNALTSEWRILQDAQTYTSGTLNSSQTSFSLLSGSGISPGMVLWIGNECMRIDSGANPFTVNRAHLDTEARAHVPSVNDPAAPVFIYNRYLVGRRLKLYIAPIDGGSASDEQLFDTYLIDRGPTLSEDGNSYTLRAKSQNAWLKRIVNRRKTNRFIIEGESLNEEFGFADKIYVARYGAEPNRDAVPVWPSKRCYLKIGDEIVVGSETWLTFDIHARGQLGTRRAPWSVNDVVTAVFGADDDPTGLLGGYEPTFFRWSPGGSPSSDRSSGTWNRSSHYVDIILNLLTSSADTSDGLELANRNTTYGAWDCLPVGVGVGVPVAQIDVGSMVALKQPDGEVKFPSFYVPEEPVSLGDLISESFLRPAGAYLSISGGQARIVKMRPPLAGDSGATIGDAQILRRMVSANRYQSRARLRVAEDVISTVIVKMLDHTVVLNNKEHGALFGPSTYTTDTKSITIDVRAVSNNGKIPDWLYQSIASYLAFNRKPRQIITFPTDLSSYALDVGEQITLTASDLPNHATGTRGLSSVAGIITERALSFDAVDDDGGIELLYEAVLFPNSRVGRIAPSARIASITDAAGTPDITITTNRYTQSDSLDLPNTDAECFAVNDVLRLRSRAGVLLGGGATQTVTGVSGDIITLNGNFGGTLTNGTGNAGQILEYATRTNAIAQQYDAHVFYADKANRNVGASSQAPWYYR